MSNGSVETPSLSCKYVYILLSTTRKPLLVPDPDFLDKRTPIYVPLWMSFRRLLIPLQLNVSSTPKQ